MTQAALPPDHQLEGIPTREILEGFARLHQLVVVCDRGGRVVWMSDALGVICGGVDCFIGKSVRELFPRMPDWKRISSVSKRVLRQESLENVRLELEGKSGEPLAVDVSAFRVTGTGDRHPLIVAIVRLVAGQPSELVEGSEFHESVLAAAPDAVITLDASNFITYANPAAETLLAAGAGSLAGRPMALFLPHASGLDHQATAVQELELRLLDGRRVWTSVSSRPLRDASGAPTGSVVLMRDISEEHREREVLERKNAELESFVHSVSHDLRSPLVSLLGFGRLLRQDYENRLDETGRHYLERVEQAGRTMEALLQDLLELSRIGRPGEHRVLVDPRAVLMQLQAELKPRLDEQGAKLVLPENPPLLSCDRTRIYQVFSNLIGNALDHMGPTDDPTISVSIREESDLHHIVVQDNGQGVEPDQRERIFDAFHTAGRRPGGGRSTGIGLAIVKKIAETHEGRVWVESEPGAGAAFHLTLPRQ
ncbi:MAG: ATP-binding protein [Proteobacteria bacterium]|nr:ATP-binding protein [Pseudomonadota bacterium]